MADTTENKPDHDKKQIVAGILAHVDAGKTTLAESLLYLSGQIRTLGRVDHKDAFLDTHALERERGITIFSKQARLAIGEKHVILLDTPGHVDFSAEMERTLQVLDYAVLVISGGDGVQGHVDLLWRLLRHYQIPVFLFINKMDQEGTDRASLMEELTGRLSENCVDFSDMGDENARSQFWENLALCDENAMEQYLEQGLLHVGQICRLVRERKVFPCYFGSALKLWGVDALMEGISRYTQYRTYPDAFGARVFKISRDEKGNRLTHMKITGGSLRVKALLQGKNDGDKDGKNQGPEEGAGRKQPVGWQEKADQLRCYSGSNYELQQEVAAGGICAVTGLTHTFAGEGLGVEEEVNQPLLAPVLNYRLFVPEGQQANTLLSQMRQLEEEEPLLHVLWNEEVGEIHVQLMGEVQIEVLKTIVRERFHTEVEFDSGSIVYKETLTEPVEGVGHFEPLRHYAEVHLLMEPGEPGSGLVFSSSCSEDVLDKNWQRLILTHLKEKKHKGVLTGSQITDLKITLVAGRAHQKHTEGGDFRQATYRALRQGLKMGNCRLLEPVYAFRLEVPADSVGRAMTDLQRMHGTFSGPEPAGNGRNTSILTGKVPAAAIQGYQAQLISYTKGMGRLFCSLKGYEPCQNEAEVIAAIGYDSEQDLENPSGSVFCAHGAGFLVDYDRVYDYMHLEGILAKKKCNETEPTPKAAGEPACRPSLSACEEQELEEIFQRTYGGKGQERKGYRKKNVSGKAYQGARTAEYGKVRTSRRPVDEKEYLLVDGYNIIFGWEELNQLAKIDMGAARGRLMDLLSNYQGYKKNTLILVFDAYKVEGNPGSSQKYHNIHVVYTKEAETADQYIEKVTHEIAGKHKVTVATSDGLEQVIILGQGAVRMSALGLQEEIEATSQAIQSELRDAASLEKKNYALAHRLGELEAERKKSI